MADLEAHSQFALFLFYGLPAPAQSEDVNRLTLAYFLISSLDLLHSLSHIDAKQVIDWVYGHQVLPATNFHDSGTCFMGFRGSLSAGVQFSPLGASALVHDGGHLASTYSALAILTILGDDLCRVRKHALLVSMRKLQQQDGSFTSVHMGMEADLRFVYCAEFSQEILNISKVLASYSISIGGHTQPTSRHPLLHQNLKDNSDKRQETQETV
ncbi:hypothetical protein L7F22_048925 [Adiantum nelumboides]|nr:hypothetical protein [Adiantum nelumboides]